jgi:hypothetical protein
MNPKMNLLTKRTAQGANPNEKSSAKCLQLEKDNRAQRDGRELEKREECDGRGSEKREEAKDAPLPKHSKRLFIQALLFWQNEYGNNRQCQGKFLVDSGCTGAILNTEFVAAHKLPWVRRKTPVEVRSADGTPVKDAGSKYSTPLTMRIGHHQEEVSWEIGKLVKGISGYLPVEWLTRHNPEIDWQTGVLKWRSQYCKHHCLPVSMRDAVRNFVKMLRESKVWEVDGPQEVDGPGKVDGPAIASTAKVSAAGVAGASDGIEWHDEEGGKIADRLPERYRRWASVFSEEDINRLPDHTEYNHKIQLVDGAQPPFVSLHPLSEKELQALREYLRKELAAGKIRESRSPAGAPIIFVPKPDGSLRLCVDYRGLNGGDDQGSNPFAAYGRTARALWSSEGIHQVGPEERLQPHPHRRGR